MSFQIKSPEELAKLDTKQVAEYLAAKNKHDREQLETAIKDKASAEELERFKAEVTANNAKLLDQMEQAQEALKQQGLHLSRMAQGSGPAKEKSIKQVLEESQAVLKSLRQGDISKSLQIVTNGKAAAIMTFANNITGEIPQSERIPGYDALPLRPRSFLSTLRQATTNSNRVTWVYQTAREGAPAVVAEGDTKPLQDFNLVEDEQAVVKYAARTVATMEMLEDIGQLEDAIRFDLLERLLLEVELGAYSGAGTTGLLNGVRTVAPAFSAPTGMAGAIDNADTVDVLSAAFVQISESFQAQPTHIFMNPIDVALMKSYKVDATDRRRVMSVYTVGEELRFGGAVIVPTYLVDQDEFLIGHMPYAALYNRMAPVIKVGLGTGDFENNRVTLLSEWRGTVVVKNNQRNAFVKGAFSTAKAALETT